MERRNYSAEEIQKKFDSLPEEIKALLYSPEMMDVIKKVGEKHQLHIDQLDLLENDTAQVMLGFIQTKDYPVALMDSLNVTQIKADMIAQDMNDMLFVKIRDSMKKTDMPVIMPSNKSASTPQPISTVPTPTTHMVSAAMPMPKPAFPVSSIPIQPPTAATQIISVPMQTADVMLTKTTVSMAKKIEGPPVQNTPPSATKIEIPTPGPYKTDPYREPPE